MSNLTMADLLAKQTQFNTPQRGDEIEGTVFLITNSDVILDLGAKSDGVLPKKELAKGTADSLKIGDKLKAFVVATDRDSNQIILSLTKAAAPLKPGSRTNLSSKFDKFKEYIKSKQVLTAKGLEVNKGGLIVEIGGVRGFLPASQASLSTVANLEDLAGQDIEVTVVEVDPGAHRLILSQKSTVSEDTKTSLSKLKIGDKVKGKIAAVLPFGVFVTLENGVEGLVHVSEVAWEKVEDVAKVYKIGDEIEAEVVSVEEHANRVNLSIKKLTPDPFAAIADKFKPDDVVKATVTKVTTQGISFRLEGGAEAFMGTTKIEEGTNYQPGQAITCLVDTIDTQKRRINLVPFVTSTAGLIYK